MEQVAEGLLSNMRPLVEIQNCKIKEEEGRNGNEEEKPFSLFIKAQV
jgi:hypothetical protein